MRVRNWLDGQLKAQRAHDLEQVRTGRPFTRQALYRLADSPAVAASCVAARRVTCPRAAAASLGWSPSLQHLTQILVISPRCLR